MCSSFSAVGDDFVIEFTVHLFSDGSQVTSVIDLKSQVYGKVMITDFSGIPQNLDLHFREVTADTDNSPGGDEFIIQSKRFQESMKSTGLISHICLHPSKVV